MTFFFCKINSVFLQRKERKKTSVYHVTIYQKHDNLINIKYKTNCVLHFNSQLKKQNVVIR